MVSRRPPADVRRELRRRANYGCCVCGIPIYQYHHIVEWAEEQHHRVEDMMLLCPLHHDAATKGVLSLAEQRRRQATPYNQGKDSVLGAFIMNQQVPGIVLGQSVFVAQGTGINVDDEPLLSLRYDRKTEELNISLTLRDANGDVVLLIEENEWVAGTQELYDLYADHAKLSIRQKKGDMFFEFDATQQPPRLRCTFSHKGVAIKIGAANLIYEAGGENKVTFGPFGHTGTRIDLFTEAHPDGPFFRLANIGHPVPARFIAAQPDELVAKTVAGWVEDFGPGASFRRRTQ